MYLEDLFDYKNKLAEILCSNEEIVRLVTGSKEAPVPHYSLMYDQIFPYQFIPETVDDAQTFICFDVDVLSVDNKTTYNPALYVFAFTHKDLLRLDEGGVRTDKLACEIDKLLNGNRFFGLGELGLYSVERFVPIANYQGRILTYSMKEFNRSSRSKEAPANRKQRG